MTVTENSSTLVGSNPPGLDDHGCYPQADPEEFEDHNTFPAEKEDSSYVPLSK